MCPTEYLFFSLSDFSFFAQSNMLQRLNEEETVRESQALFSFFFFFLEAPSIELLGFVNLWVLFL